jgi:thiol-disulfide isomerase/thioredoxin
MRRLALSVGFLTLSVSKLIATTPVLRRSPEFTIYDSSGKTILLSSLKGKVVVLEFLFIRSPHCLRVAQILNKLQGELGPRGFQPVGIVFGMGANESEVSNLVQYFKLAYPVGYTSSDKVDNYLGRKGNEILKIPQVVVIDRIGMIRATSGTKGDPNLENENPLRDFINTLLSESVPATKKGRSSSPSKNVPSGAHALPAHQQ